MSAEYDLVVIGGGPAGYVGAIRASQLGMKVACVEKRKELGGTCLTVGCIPSKALLDSSEHYLFTKTKLKKHGVIVGDVGLDLGAMMSRKDGVVKSLTSGVAGLFKKHKIEHILGVGSIRNANEVIVTTDGKETFLKAKKILIATGSDPIELPFLPFDGKKILSSTEALAIPKVPKHLVVIGAGYIGLELGSVWARLGSQVTVLEFMDKILPFADQQLAKELHKSLEKQGLKIRLGTKCLGAKVKGENVTVQIEETATGNKSEIECDYVLVSTGRKPASKNLGIELSQDARGFVQVSSHYETSVPGIFAVGDVIGGAMLAHKASEEAVACVERMVGQAGHVNYGAIPSVIYTWPELASVGESEEALKARGIAYKVGTFPFIANGRAKAMDETEGLVKVISDATSDRVLAVHIFGPRASDMIAEAVAIVEFGGSAEDIGRISHSHPTLSESMKEAALAVDKRQIHL